jgi:hypothetical protein
VILSLFFSFLFLPTACQPKLPPPLPQSFTVQAQITFGETSFTASIEQTCPGSLRLEFTDPPELAGMRMQVEGGTAIVGYGEMELSLPTPSLPQAGFAALLYEALGELAQPAEESTRRVTGGWEVQGTAGGLDWTARLDTEGVPRGIDMPGAGLRIILA